MSDFITRLKRVMKEKGITQIQLATDMNIRVENFRTWTNNGGMPRCDLMFKIADYLEVDVYWLATGELSKPKYMPFIPTLTEKELYIIDTYRNMPEMKKGFLYDMCRVLRGDEKKDTPEGCAEP